MQLYFCMVNLWKGNCELKKCPSLINYGQPMEIKEKEALADV